MDDIIPDTGLDTEPEEPQEETFSPDIVDVLAPSILSIPDYETASSKLKDLYATTPWQDKEIAAQKVADLADTLNKRFEVTPQVTLGGDAATLQNRMLDETLDEPTKLKAIEDWRTSVKESLYNVDEPDSLFSARSAENTVDAYADQFRRGIVAGDRGRLIDMMARGAESALYPLVGTADLVFGTESKGSLTKLAKDYENPAYDESFVSKVASGAGTVAGFAVSSLNPFTAWGYLGATLIDQGKSVYDTALQQSGSEDTAAQALVKSAPGIAVGTFADRIVGGSLGAVARGQKGFLGAFTGLAAGAAGNVAQTAGTGFALSSATGETSFEPGLGDLAEAAAVGGILGGAVGALGDVAAKVKVDAIKFQAAKSLDRAQAQMKETLGGATVPDAPKETSFAEQFIAKPEDIKVTAGREQVNKDMAAGLVEEPGPSNATQFISQKTSDEAARPTADKFQKVLTPAPAGYTPQPFIIEMVKDWDSVVHLGNTVKDEGAWGFYDPNDDSIHIERKIFKDLGQAYGTLAHEFGHLLDFAGRNEEIATALALPPAAEEPVLHKLIRISRSLQLQHSEEVVNKQARKLSSAWRPGWLGARKVPEAWKLNPPKEGTPEYSQMRMLEYRNRNTEIQADTMSAIFNNPSWVQENYPAVWKAFEAGLETQPKVKEFWNEVVEFNTKPEKFQGWLTERREEGRLKEAAISAKAIEDRILAAKEAKQEQKKAAVPDIRHRFINRLGPARDIIEKVTGPVKEKAEKWYADLLSTVALRNKLEAKMDVPVGKIYEKYLSLNFPRTETDPLSTWKDFERDNRILNETSETIESIKASPEKYAAAWNDVLQFLESSVGQRVGSPVTGLKGKELVDALVKNVGLVEVTLRHDNEKIFALQENLINAGKTDAAELLSRDAFNVREYLANPLGDKNIAQKNMTLLKEQLGDERFSQLKDISKQFHDVMGNYLFEVLSESGTVNPKLVEKMKLNNNNWVHFNVLKYFEQDPRVTASIKQQIGTISDIGDELAATIKKTKAIISFGEYQKGQNAAVNLARLGGYEVRPVSKDVTFRRDLGGKSRAFKENIFELKDKLQAENPENSYLVEFNEGRPTLYEVNSPAFGKIFEESKLDKVPAVGLALRAIENFNKIFAERELKTTLSPIFVIRQKFYDTMNEAVLAKAWSLPGLPFHINPRLRAIKKEALASAKLREQGIFTPDVRHLIDTNTLAAHMAEDHGGFDNPSMKAENATYELMGQKIPGEEDLSTPIKINRKINKTLEKVGFGRIRRMAERDEAATKIAAYHIAKEFRGMGDNEAARFAREFAGTPDPLNGGIEGTNLNKLFLFGRAHINGMRAVANLFKKDGRGYMMRYAYYKGLPRLMLSSAIMAPLISSLFGDEEGEIAKRYLDKIPEFDKLSKIVIPFGFLDGQRNYRGFDVKAKDIGTDWKAAYLRLPIARELVSVDNLFTPTLRAIEELGETGTFSFKHFGQNAAASLKAVAGGQLAPFIQAGYHVTSLAAGFNPYDMYRKRGILTPDVEAAGTMVQKTYEYLLWSAAATAPGLFTFRNDVQGINELNSPIDVLAKLPVVGSGPASVIKGLFGTSNYGDFEKSTALLEQRKERDADIRLNLGDNSKLMLNEYRKSQSVMSQPKEIRDKMVSQGQINRAHLVNNWHSRAYRHAFNELRAAVEKGDTESIEIIKERLEKLSTDYLGKIK